ncbi:uncharacterized protein LOC131214235, partial [Anopheles bellator]|uniref:uncharacterized protein LOC131214235 n=1 Tax=Anopheles bellator TaxID=139047 RepID=UPI00264935A9
MLVDATCNASTALNKLLLGNIFWLFLEEANGTEPVTISDGSKGTLQTLYSERLRKLQALPYTNIVIGSRNEGGCWQLFEAFRFPSQSFLVMEEIAVILQPADNVEETLRAGLEHLRKQNHRRRNMNGFRMSCAGAVTAPEYYKGPDDTTDTIHDVYMRSNFPIIKGLMQDMNFTINMIQVDSGGWKKNGTFTTGLFGKFQNRSIEIGCTGALMRTERLEVVDFLA